MLIWFTLICRWRVWGERVTDKSFLHLFSQGEVHVPLPFGQTLILNKKLWFSPSCSLNFSDFLLRCMLNEAQEITEHILFWFGVFFCTLSILLPWSHAFLPREDIGHMSQFNFFSFFSTTDLVYWCQTEGETIHIWEMEKSRWNISNLSLIVIFSSHCCYMEGSMFTVKGVETLTFMTLYLVKKYIKYYFAWAIIKWHEEKYYKINFIYIALALTYWSTLPECTCFFLLLSWHHHVISIDIFWHFNVISIGHHLD